MFHNKDKMVDTRRFSRETYRVSPTDKTASRRDRSFELKPKVIDLKQVDYTKRLIELCNQGRYKYYFFWDLFFNGIMMSCQIYYLLDGRKNIVEQKSKFLKNKTIDEAKDIISFLLLSSLGLEDNELLEDKKNELPDNKLFDEMKEDSKISWAEA